jgi:hypothetical protein
MSHESGLSNDGIEDLLSLCGINSLLPWWLCPDSLITPRCFMELEWFTIESGRDVCLCNFLNTLGSSGSDCSTHSAEVERSNGGLEFYKLSCKIFI